MKKTFALPLLAALLLAACSNPADSSNPLSAPAPQVSESETWPKITPVNWEMDLEGYEEAPKDPVYGINWVYVAKTDVEKYPKYLSRQGLKLKPVEIHASNPNGVQFHATDGSYSEAAYKCVIHYKKDFDLSKNKTILDGWEIECKINETYFNSPALSVEYNSSKQIVTTKVLYYAEEFKKYYGQL